MSSITLHSNIFGLIKEGLFMGPQSLDLGIKDSQDLLQTRSD